MNLSLRVGAARGRGFSSFLPRELAGENSVFGGKKKSRTAGRQSAEPLSGLHEEISYN